MLSNSSVHNPRHLDQVGAIKVSLILITIFRIIYYPKLRAPLMTMKTVRYHLQLSDHRTTISLDKIISDLMAIKLGATPGTREAHKVVQNQLDKFIERDRGRGGFRLGRYISKHAVLFISDNILSEKYLEYEFACYEVEKF